MFNLKLHVKDARITFPYDLDLSPFTMTLNLLDYVHIPSINHVNAKRDIDTYILIVDDSQYSLLAWVQYNLQ